MSRMSFRIRTGIVLAALAIPGGQAFAAPRATNDPFFEEQTYLHHIGAPEAWNHSLGFEGVIVAVIDSGVDIRHPDLRDNIWRNVREIPGDGIDNDGNGYIDDVHGWDFVDSDNDPRPTPSPGDLVGTNHGTVSAGIIAARGDNGIGISGVTWQTTIMPLRALGSDGSGDPTAVVRAIEYAMNNGAKVINLSFTGPVEGETLRIAVRRAYERGVFVVAAAGNAPEGGVAQDLDARPLFPVCLDAGESENFIYGVAAVDAEDRKASFSNYGAGCVDGAAPGTRFIGTQYYDASSPAFADPYGGYYNGTSVAAPVVSGVAALLLALDSKLTPKQITNILTQSAVAIDEKNPAYFGKLGRGRIDAAKAVALLREGMRVIPATPTVPTQTLVSPDVGVSLVATAPGPGRAPEVQLFTEDGLYVRGFSAYPAAFRGGVSLAVARFDGPLRQTIVTGAGPGGGPHVRIFNVNTQAIGGFMAYDEAFRGGVTVATADVMNDAGDEIVTGAGPGGGPHVRIFDDHGTPLRGFFAFEEAFRGGIHVAAGDVDGDGVGEVIVASGRGRTTAVRVFRADGTLVREMLPFGERDVFGATVEVADLDGDGDRDLIVRSLASTGTVRFLRGDGTTIDTASAPYLLGSQAGSQPLVASFSARGIRIDFAAYELRFMGGVRAARVWLE